MSAANASKDEGSTRKRILDAALELFAQHGFAGTSMRTLARATGLRESSIYNHFAGKADLYESVIAGWGPTEFVTRLSSAEYRALADQPVALFAICAQHLIDRWLDPKERLFTAMISADPAGGDAQKRYYRALFHEEIDLLAGYIAGFAQSGLIRACDARESARMFAAGLTFIRMEHVTFRRENSARSDVEAAVSRYLDNFTALLVNPAQ